MLDHNACPDCDMEMQEIRQSRHVFRPDPDTMTDGQLAEQHAAEMGGPFEEDIHGVTTRMTECPECGKQIKVR